MARYEHLSIFRDAYDLAVHLEKIVRNFSRYHKYTLGTELRNQSRRILDLIVRANEASEGRAARLLELRQELESLKVLARLCQDAEAFASTRSYLHVAERITNLARQNEGWLKQTQGRSSRRAPPDKAEPRIDPPLQLTLNERRRLRPVADGIDFLGYIVRPDYLLVRRRVVSACYERLARAEKVLVQQGLVLGERPVYPWHWPTLVMVYRWLNAYLAHFRHAASHRLVARLWQRFPWLAEYFRRVGERVVYTVPPPRPALRLDQQKAQFSSRLPGHVLVVQVGTWCELWGGNPAYPLSEAERRLPRKRLPAVAAKLKASGAPVAWIGQTGCRVTNINERALMLRWPGVARPGSLAAFLSA